MRVRVPVAVRNRLQRLEGRRHVDLPVGGWPPLMDLGEWEALASCMQDDLVALARQDEGREPSNLAANSLVSPAHENERSHGGRRASVIEEYFAAKANRPER